MNKLFDFIKGLFQKKNIEIPAKLYEQNTNGKFLFIRHGQTYFNKYSKERGSKKVKTDKNLLDSELSEEGINEGKKFSEFYKQFKIEEIYVSPLYRALQSAYYLFKDHPEKNNIVIKVHPLLTEITNAVHDISFDLINRNKKDFNLNSEIKFDWSLFDEIYKNEEEQNFYYFENIDRLDNNIIMQQYDIISNSYGKENYKDNIINLIKLSLDKSMESPKHVFERFIKFKNFLRDKYKDKLNDTEKKVFVVTHSSFLKCGTSKNIFYYNKNNGMPSDGCFPKNFEVLSIFV